MFSKSFQEAGCDAMLFALSGKAHIILYKA